MHFIFLLFHHIYMQKKLPQSEHKKPSEDMTANAAEKVKEQQLHFGNIPNVGTMIDW